MFPNSRHWRLLLAGVGLTSLATLLVELALTRLFSVLLFYHFAFMAISIALLGLGAGGLCSYWIAGQRPLEVLWARLARLAAANALLTIAAVAIVLRLKVPPLIIPSTLLPIAVIYFVSMVPFFFAGTILSVLLARTVARAGTVYFADLGGASAGGLLLIPLLDWLGAPNTLLFAAGVWAASACLWTALDGRSWRRWTVLPLLFAALITANARFRFLDVEFAKGRKLGPELYSRWNSFSRVTLNRSDDGLWILIDADAATRVADVPVTDREFWRRQTTHEGAGLAYVLRPGSSALIIGPGGGFDVACALAAGSRDVTGVEINPIIVEQIMLGRMREASHHLYERPGVRVVVEDGRSYLRRSPQRYGVIQATLVDTWASISAGAFALTESNLYTVEAFREYLGHLQPDGILSITRWEFRRPREALRLVSLGLEALRSEGAQDPGAHFVIVADSPLNDLGTLATVLVKRSPFTPAELQAVRNTLRGTPSMTALYWPDQRLDTPFDQLLRAANAAAFLRAYAFDITPVHDNRPFFFFNVKTRDVLSLWGYRYGMDSKLNLSLLLLLVVLLLSGIGVLLFLVVPARLSARLPRAPGVRPWLLYFMAIGLAYILVEVAMIQKFVLFLGHPTYAVAVAVCWLLAASGAGSYWSRRWPEPALAARLARLLPAIAALIGLLALAVTRPLTALVSLPLAARLAVAAALLAPAGFLMGAAFPTGLRLVGRLHPAALQWAWAMNAAASVLGSALAVFVSIHFGIWQTLAAGGACYLVAAAMAGYGEGLARSSRTAASTVPASVSPT